MSRPSAPSFARTALIAALLTGGALPAATSARAGEAPAGAHPAAPPAAATSALDRSVHLRADWRDLTRGVASAPAWSADGRRFHYRKTVEGGFAFVDVDADTFAERPAFDPALIARGLAPLVGAPVDPAHLPFAEFAYAPDGEAITFLLDYVPTRCSLKAPVCGPADTGPARQPRGFDVVRDRRVAPDNHPRLSPDGQWEALVLNDNLAVRPAGGGAPILVSRDGSPGDFYDPESIVWAPDSRTLALYRVRPGYPRLVTRVLSSPADGGQPQLVQQLYPKPGDAVDIERPVLFDIAGRRPIPVDDALFADPYQLSPLRWRADGKSVAFDYVHRGHDLVRIVSVDAATGVAHAAVTERSTTFVDLDRVYSHDVADAGRDIVWASERDGWRHLYLIDGATGRIKTQITRGAWVVRDIIRVDDAKRRIWFSASGRTPGQDPYYKHYYRVDFDGSHLTQLTSAPATHEVRFSPDMSRYLDLYSRVDQPDVLELHAADGRLLRTVAQGDISRLLAAGFRAPQPFVAKGRDGRTDIWGLVVRPRDFDPARRYPVIENIYAGPHDNFVPKTFWPFGYHAGGDKVVGMQALADLGFIVVQIDGMGTANRSKAFHDVAWKNLADSGFPDRIAWLRALARQEPAADLSRVGIYGASAGGQSALNALLFHPEFYKAAVAFAGCYDNRMDKISWNEQWLGYPVDKSYLDASGVVHAANLQGALLMIVGEQDSNVDPASTFQVADALIKAGKDFDLMVVPGGEHSVGRSTGPIDYVQRRQFRFFLDKLAPPAR